MELIKQIARELNISNKQVAKTVELLEAGNTIPFIARYRKEATEELNENVLRDIQDRLNYLTNLQERKSEIIRLIAEQEKLTPELESQIKAATKLTELEDLYRPYKQKRRTRATMAKEKGLEPLAQIIIAQEITTGNIDEIVKPYINPDLKVHTTEDALSGALDIIAETISDDASIRQTTRELTNKYGFIITKTTSDTSDETYRMYFDYQEPISKIPSHRILAINRGEKEKALNVKIEAPIEKIITAITTKTIVNKNSLFTSHIINSIEDAYKRLIAPSIEREMRNELTSNAEEQAIKIFSQNLRNLLLQPPVKGQIVLGIDPGYRTGCKLSTVDETGKVLDIGVIYPHAPQNRWEEAKENIKNMIRKTNANVITIGNGTASRETETLVAELISELEENIQYIIVSEAGASVYSASKVANEEFPEYDLSLRSAVSIARRLQDPLAELVKIEPKAIGVGQYQHDVTPKRLDESLTGVVESAVNTVGVDINTASVSLLKYVSGLGAAVAKSIVAYREKNGKFKLRSQFKKVPRLGDHTFTQCAGFLRIPGGENPLENTSVHPESYGATESLLSKLGFSTDELKGDNLTKLKNSLDHLTLESTAEELGLGVPTLKDIVDDLKKPGRDPREDLPKPIFRRDVTKLEDLSEGMILSGTVRNVVDFGAFVDIGVKQDGMVHISELADKFVKHPMDVVSVGDQVKARVISIDLQRGRVGLSMKEI